MWLFICDEPDCGEPSRANWIKQWYGHLKNNISYQSIMDGIQIRHKIYYTSQMNINIAVERDKERMRDCKIAWNMDDAHWLFDGGG